MHDHDISVAPACLFFKEASHADMALQIMAEHKDRYETADSISQRCSPDYAVDRQQNGKR